MQYIYYIVVTLTLVLDLDDMSTLLLLSNISLLVLFARHHVFPTTEPWRCNVNVRTQNMIYRSHYRYTEGSYLIMCQK